MSDQTRNGQVPSPEEFFDHCLLLADITEQSLLDAQALRDEVRRSLTQTVDRLDRGSEASLRKFQEAAGKMQELYAPDSVRKAAENAQKTVGNFGGDLTRVFSKIEKEARAAAKPFWIRTSGAAAITLIGVVAFVGLALKYVPSLDEVKARRAEMEALQIQPVDYDGGKWVQITDMAKSCKKDNPKECVQYGRIY